MSWFWIQFIIFQVLWLVAVIGGNQFVPLCLLLLGVHFFLSPSSIRDLSLWPLALLGLSIDSALTLAKVFEFSVLPVWLAMIWIAFVMTLSHSLAWLKKLPFVLLPPIGAVAGTASYMAGWRLEAVEFPRGPLVSAMVLAGVWAVLLPVLVKFETKIGSAT